MQQAWAHYPASVFCVFFFFQENVILGSDYPFSLGEHHPGKLIEDVYKDDLELRVTEQSHSVSRFCLFVCLFVFFLPLIKRRRRRFLTPYCCDPEILLPW